MDSSSKIENLRMQIVQEQNKIDSCKHEYSEPYYNSETVKEGYGSVQDGSGSDPHWGYAGYRDVQKDRWTKKCNKCGHCQHTYNQEPIFVGYKPKF